jgi:predicted metal-dependent phosphoesterase TrpH
MDTIPRHIDLHIHSHFSDGVFSPADLVRRARAEGIDAIAIADHDSVAGVPEALAAGRQERITVLPAVELSVQFKGWKDVHLLGYCIDYTDPAFLERLNGFRERREHRNEEILDRVNERLKQEDRVPVPLDDVMRHAREAMGRPHIARAMLERGYVDSLEEAFRNYLIPCNVPKSYWPMDEAIGEIKRIGGVAVLAHPTSISTTRWELRAVITELAALGLDGIEVYNNLAQPHEMAWLKNIADELGLLAGAGSDFHGIEDGILLGRGRNGIRFDGGLLGPIVECSAGRARSGLQH